MSFDFPYYPFYQHTGAFPVDVNIGVDVSAELSTAGAFRSDDDFFPPDDFSVFDGYATNHLQSRMSDFHLPEWLVHSVPTFIPGDDECGSAPVFGHYVCWCFRLSSQIDTRVRAGFWRLVLELPFVRNCPNLIPSTGRPSASPASEQFDLLRLRREQRVSETHRVRAFAEEALYYSRDTLYTFDSFLLEHGLWRGSGVNPAVRPELTDDFGAWDVSPPVGRTFHEDA